MKFALAFALAASLFAAQDEKLPELTQPVNDFAHVIDAPNAAAMDRMIRQLKAATGDVVVVATVQTIEPYGDIREYANKLFENQGRGIGDKGKDNGLLILLAVNEHKVWVEVGYTLERWITDGYAGETSRDDMVPQFRRGAYGAGMLAGTTRIIGRVAEGRGVSLEGVSVPAARQRSNGGGIPLVYIIVFIIIMILSRIGGGPGRRRGFWSSGIGPFGGGFGGGFAGGGGGGFGGGFGGFGGGSSGGGGGGGSW